MRGTVTTNKLKEANEWLAKIDANEKELRFVMGKKTNYICLVFHLRCDKMNRQFNKFIKSKEKDILSRGWDIGDFGMSYCSRDILVTAIPTKGVSCIELKCKFNLGKDALDELKGKIGFIGDTINLFRESINDLKVSVDIKYYVEKDFKIDKNNLKEILVSLSYKENNNSKGYFRKFEIMNKHNITNIVELKEANNAIDAQICISVDNIVIEQDNLEQEIVFSLYYYITEYTKLHYYILNDTDKEYIKDKEKFYSKVISKI